MFKNTARHIIFEAGAQHVIGGKGVLQSSKNFADCKDVVQVDVAVGKREVHYSYPNGTLVTEYYESFQTTGAIRQYNSIKNNSDQAIRINQFTISVDILCDGILRWNHEDRFKIHYCLTTWCGETQWKSASFIDFGMGDCRYPLPGAAERALFRSKGSWSTASYYPMIVLEDMEKGICYYFENECSSNWEMEISKPFDCIKVTIDTANIDHDGWSLVLNPGEEYITTSGVYGMVEGSFEDAVRELNKYKKESSLAYWENGYAPICYNNYMGATYSRPDARLIPIIDAAAEAGCEVFCIDAGWFRRGDAAEPDSVQGDYVIYEKRFAPYTFQEVIDHIKAKNMVPGIWFEFEAVTDNAQGAKISNGRCTRDGYVISEARGFYDMTNEEVREHLFGAVKRVYDMGIRFIKNDYNNSLSIGMGVGNYNEYAKEQMRANYSFIDELYVRFPDLLIENCGSGAMRSDHAMLKRCVIQSTSDQEIFFKNPSIIQGSLAVMPSAKAGIWTYPYHVDATAEEFHNPDEETVRINKIAQCIDGENTIFNMVTGNMGAMYMSGRLDWADDYNKKLIHEGTALYKQNREFVANAYPVYPTGMRPIGTSGLATLGLMDEAKTKMLLAVWKIEDFNEIFTIDLSSYIRGDAALKMVYPAEDKTCEYCFGKNGRLTIKLSGAKSMGRLFEITL